MRLPRMTTRRWMAAVAVVAFAIAAGQMWRRSIEYAGRARRYAMTERYLRETEAIVSKIKPSDRPFGAHTPRVGLPVMIAHFADLRRKYEHAARYPWVPVEPDPPAPE
jgi:hypothetical protein